MSQYNKVKGTFFLKGTTFVYVLSSDWLNYAFDTLYTHTRGCVIYKKEKEKGMKNN
jgi:hypothetical protein